MRWYELAGGIFQMLSNEEDKIFKLIQANNNKYKKDDLDIRQQEIAKKMYSKGILNAFKKDNIVYYEINTIEEISRGF